MSNEVLRNATYSTGSSSSSSYNPDDAPTSASIFSSAIDPTALHPLAGLTDKDLDYLLLDDDKISAVDGGQTVLPSRGWTDELCYGTGATYLAGLGAGGLWGLREGLRKPLLPRAGAAATNSVPLSTTSILSPTASSSTKPSPPGTAPFSSSAVGSQAAAFAKAASAEAIKTGGAEGAAERAKLNAANTSRVSARLRWNNILNQVTRRGSFTGNSAGVLAFMYNAFNSSLDSYRGGKHDIYGSMAAGAMTGALWKSTAGVKPMVVSAGILTLGAAGWTTVKTQFL